MRGLLVRMQELICNISILVTPSQAILSLPTAAGGSAARFARSIAGRPQLLTQGRSVATAAAAAWNTTLEIALDALIIQACFLALSHHTR